MYILNQLCACRVHTCMQLSFSLSASTSKLPAHHFQWPAATAQQQHPHLWWCCTRHVLLLPLGEHAGHGCLKPLPVAFSYCRSWHCCWCSMMVGACTATGSCWHEPCQSRCRC